MLALVGTCSLHSQYLCTMQCDDEAMLFGYSAINGTGRCNKTRHTFGFEIENGVPGIFNAGRSGKVVEAIAQPPLPGPRNRKS